MPKKETEKLPPTPPHNLVTDEQAREFLKVEELSILNNRINELANILWRHEGMDKAELNVRITRAIEHYNSLKPSDGAEGMLAQQMVGTHFAAMECLRRAALPNQTFEGRDMALKHAHKLMTLYARQLETLNKHRGKGQQKVTVEHIRVERGGQAIVGNVEASGKRNAGAHPPELDHKPDDSVPLEMPEAKTVSQGKAK
ncbi:hypothetical protein G6N82_09065 [Altererythrobacter sp. BO-6]|uniref:hypothetical protein n=1 Tax=Altererythrobacter sp. BO-6 TaxID=2604537 RepID=UPI0013E1C84F|nr:hypothetical protein [Altererythrobacter sp. BO-6]QIG54276.1 hypothetical protein G6N82_09065 [Altererythrobacter sp. BO-6]